MTRTFSPKLPHLLAGLFPGSKHVRDCGLLGFTDDTVWDYAGAHGFIVVSKDSDFHQRSLLYGPPPKLVWLRIGNCTRQEPVGLTTAYQQEIQVLEDDALEAVLVLS